MSSAITERAKAEGALAPRPRVDSAAYPWLLVALGLLIVYTPSLIGLATDIWSSNEQAHGPIVLCGFLWLMYREWPGLYADRASRGSPWGWPLLVIGLLCYIAGRSLDLTPFEIGSLVIVLAAIVLLLRGWPGLRRVGFALVLLCFIVPIPGQIMTAFTLPIAIEVSKVVDYALFTLGYPIAREGVVLQLGPYQLLVANACAGLHTFFALEAMGLLYLNLFKHESLLRNLCLLTLIVPVAFVANVIRVISLALITYYFGDAAGQGFLHGFAGVVLFLSALLLILFADSVLSRLGRGVASRTA